MKRNLLGCLGLLAIIGGLAAIAVPAHIERGHRMKAADAIMNLRHVHDASFAYYLSEQSHGGNPTLPGEFPQSVTSSPHRSACDGTSVVGITPNSGYWQNSTWTALQFSVKDLSYFQYDYLSDGSGSDAAFTAGAHGDLDCDGKFSTFERVGSFGVDGDRRAEKGIFARAPLE